MGLSQSQFAAVRFPAGHFAELGAGPGATDTPTRVLLAVIARHPEAVEDACQEGLGFTVGTRHHLLTRATPEPEGGLDFYRIKKGSIQGGWSIETTGKTLGGTFALILKHFPIDQCAPNPA